MGKALTVDTRRYGAINRKFNKALVYMQEKGYISDLEVTTQYKPTRECVVFFAYFTYKDQKLKFIHEVTAKEKLPPVSLLRELMMDSLGEYRESHCLPKW